MFVLDNVPLNAFSTMRLGGMASHLVEITDRFKVGEAVEWANERNLPFIVVGHGSNIVWRDEGFPGLVIVNKIERFEIYKQDDETSYITAGAGEIWDSVVERAVQQGLSGVETLSLIPGTAGATPVQNVGAYGTELSDILTTVEAYDTQVNKLVTLRASECDFSYRSSRFKKQDKARFIITAVTFSAKKSDPKPPFYTSLQDYLTKNNVTLFTPASIRDAVIAIRNEKLPNPAIHPNNGSFFQNPIVEKSMITDLLSRFPEIKHWDVDGSNVKISAAWLLEHAGFKDFHDTETGMSTWQNQALVFVNENAKTTHDLLSFKAKVVDTVHEKFGITLTQEPELLP